ncbi:hypothetical protein ANTPLA_LOCUS2538 [Anthophora plagiata]
MKGNHPTDRENLTSTSEMILKRIKRINRNVDITLGLYDIGKAGAHIELLYSSGTTILSDLLICDLVILADRSNKIKKNQSINYTLFRKNNNFETKQERFSATGGKPTHMHSYAFGDEHNVHSKWIDQYLRAFGKQSNKQNLYAMFELNVS